MLFGLLSAQAGIPTWTVTTTANLGDGSLRQATDLAIANPGTNAIEFALTTKDPGYDSGTNRYTITLESALPSLPAGTTTIVNTMPSGVTIRGDGVSFRIFTLASSAVVEMTNLTISHGASADGGGIYIGSNGSLTLNFCNVSNNTSSFTGGAISAGNATTLNVTQSTFASNTAQYGGMMYTYTNGTVNINQSTLTGNAASAAGGGLYVESGSTFTSTNNTFSGNTTGGNGGAIVNQATIVLTSNTITGNTAGSGGGVANFGAATLSNNIVALNTASSFAPDLYAENFLMNPVTGTYNLIGVSDGSEGLNDPTNLRGTSLTPLDPSIGPLADNGGPNLTHALTFNSPAIDQGSASGLTIDQRGFARPINDILITDADDGSDIGAFEFAFAPSSGEVSLSGQIVTTYWKKPSSIAGARITVTAPGGETWTTTSSSFGYFVIEGLPAGSSYLVSVSHKRYSFQEWTLNLSENIEGMLFFSN